MESEHTPKPDRHIRVAGKVEIDLECVGDRSHPAEQHGLLILRRIECHVRNVSAGIGKDHLFGKTGGETHRACGKIIPGFFPVRQFRCDGIVPHDRARDQLGEQSNIQPHFQRIFFGLHFAPVHIHHIGKRLEGVETDPDGQHNFL